MNKKLRIAPYVLGFTAAGLIIDGIQHENNTAYIAGWALAVFSLLIFILFCMEI